MRTLSGAGLAALLLFALGASSCADRAVSPRLTQEQSFLSDIELTERMFGCITAAGLEGTIDLASPQGPSTGINVPAEREAAFDSINKECADELIRAGLMRQTELPSAEQLEDRYEYLTEPAQCLRENGIVPPDPPSLETYVESGGAAWVPHGAIGDQLRDIEAINEVFRACPQLP